MEEIKIDATNQTLGRLASKIALYLQDKHKPEYDPRLPGKTKVLVYNLKKVKFTGKKYSQKRYYHHTGYIGHLKERKLSELFEKNPEKLLKMIVAKMLPKNKLRKERLKRLIVKNGE